MKIDLLTILLAISSIAVGIVGIIKKEYILTSMLIIFGIFVFIILSIYNEQFEEINEKVNKLEQQNKNLEEKIGIYKDISELKAELKKWQKK